MRISDWSSDVCSSDLEPAGDGQPRVHALCRVGDDTRLDQVDRRIGDDAAMDAEVTVPCEPGTDRARQPADAELHRPPVEHELGYRTRDGPVGAGSVRLRPQQFVLRTYGHVAAAISGKPGIGTG